MQLTDACILITGAAGGIGTEIARGLAKKGAKLLLTDLRRDALEALSANIGSNGSRPSTVDADISQLSDCEAIVCEAQQELGRIDVLINVAGVMSFNEFSRESPERMELLFRVNTLAPQILSRLVLPDMLSRGKGLLVNMGSMFGSIAFPFHATYSSSKFAMRGFSEALRRELAGTGVNVLYVSPRATKTGLSNEVMAKALGMHMDSPEYVAARVVEAIERNKKECYIGFPESLFARVNGVLPRLIDQGLRKQTRLMKPFAART